MKPLNLVGNKYNLLTVLETAGKNKYNHRLWKCKCDCGNETVVESSNLIRGAVRSCGCLQKLSVIKKNFKHGHSVRKNKSPEYNVWLRMIQRCTNPKVDRYPNYGGRGIKVCERWMSSFEDFFADMGIRPSSGHSIERQNADGDYEPSNCYWGTDEEQRRNKTNNVWLEAEGTKMILADWAKMFGVSYSRLYNQVKRTNNFQEVADYYLTERAA